MNQIYIKNLSGSVFKIPFKLGTPYEVQAKVKGIIAINKSKYIPADVAIYLDMDRLEAYARRREIKFMEKKVRVPRVAIKPIAKVNSRRKPKPTKQDKVKVTKENFVKGGS